MKSRRLPLSEAEPETARRWEDMPTITIVKVDSVCVGALFRERRIGRGYTLCETAKRMGISASYLSDMERGNRSWSKSLYLRAVAVTGIARRAPAEKGKR